MTYSNSKKHSLNIQKLPLEILELIFLYSASTQLQFTSKTFNFISLPLRIKSTWLVYKFGKKNVLGKMWNIKLVSQFKNTRNNWIGCNCKLFHTRLHKNNHKNNNFNLNDITDCKLEQSQIIIIQFLRDLGVQIKHNGNISLNAATKFRHLNLIKYLIIWVDPFH